MNEKRRFKIPKKKPAGLGPSFSSGPSGFQIVFKNGYRLSVQFGASTKCNQGKTATEISVISPKGKYLDIAQPYPGSAKPWGSVGKCTIGHVYPEKLAEVMHVIAGFSEETRCFDKHPDLELTDKIWWLMI